ncbi:MAG: GNAT family N-acetyltransferase [Pseudomonadota bacterium]
MSPLRIVRDDALGPDARALIAASEAELAALYPPEARFAFSPEELTAAGTVFVVAYRGAEAVGCGGLAPLDGYGELKRIFVAKAARGTGVAAALIAALEGAARGLALPLLRLETGSDSPTAIALYTRAGYQQRGPFGSYPEDGPSVYMEKRI